MPNHRIRTRSIAMIDILNRVVVDRDGCWMIENAPLINGKPGYGRVYYQGENMGAHVVVWIIHKGPIPEGLRVLHTCDKPPCCNIEHLFLGTQKDNVQDMMDKGRHPIIRRRA